MRSKLLSALTVIGAVTVLVLAANTVALATTGKAILAGKINTSSKLTSLVRTTPGTALQVKTKSVANAPFAVNGKGKVVNLNADKVDGLDAVSLQTRSTIYRVPVQTDVSVIAINFAGLPKAVYNIDFAIIADMSADGAQLNCHLQNPITTTYQLMSYGTTFLDFSTSNGSGIMDTRAGFTRLRCFTDGGTATWDAFRSAASQIVVTRIDGTTAGTAVAGRVSSSRVPGAR